MQTAESLWCEDMKRFRYSALNTRGETVVDEIEAEDENTALVALRKEKLKPYHLTAIDQSDIPFLQRFKGSLSSLRQNYRNNMKTMALGWNRVNERSIFLFTHQLSTLLAAGVNVTAGMKLILKAETDRRFIPILKGLVDGMERGQSVYQCFRNYPTVFSRAYSGIIGIGESSGRLPDILAKQAKDLEKLYGFKRKVLASLTYPIIILTFSILSVILMMIYFVPNFTAIYKESQAKLPLITTMLISFVNSLTDPAFWITFSAVAALIYFFTGNYLKTVVGRHTFDTIALRLPVIGDLVSRNLLYSLFMNLACMLDCGVHISEALEILEDMMHNMVFKDHLAKIQVNLNEGMTFGDAIREIWFIPRYAKDFVEAGETSGELPHLIRKAAELMEEQVNEKLDTFLHLLEPVLIAVLAVVVGGVMIAIFLPISNVINSFAP
jgi:type IV pilus assembly protein PilC